MITEGAITIFLYHSFSQVKIESMHNQQGKDKDEEVWCGVVWEIPKALSQPMSLLKLKA